ncbi:MAG: T9SS type A sorting domain-containing protein [Candidatus Cloacimonetes bacterium]|nr:T9SS type A sorting domain-containing protein [Candidatus Cloacimonadota bacterium]
MRKFSFVVLLCLIVGMISAEPLAGDFYVGNQSGDNFTSLTGNNGLFNAINTNDISGDINVYITSNLDESGEISLNRNTNHDLFKIFIKPASSGLKTITGTDITKDVITIDFTRFVTIDGDYNGEKSLKFINNSTTKYAINVINSSGNFSLTNCIIQTNAKAVYILKNPNVLISYCDIQINEDAGHAYGVNASNIVNLQLFNNNIYLQETQTTSRYVNGISIVSSISSNSSVYNNIIYLKSNTINEHRGISFIGNNQADAYVYHNTVYIDGNIPDNGGNNAYSVCFYHQKNPLNDKTLNVKNNIFINNKTHTSPDYKVAVIRISDITDLNSYNIDNNIYNGNPIAYFNNSEKTNLTDWQSAWENTKDTNSKVVNPDFISLINPINLHLSDLDDYSVYYGENVNIEFDYDGDTRNASTPFIGADEVFIDDTLPVELSSFTVNATNSSTLKICWSTESESNLIGYHILRNISSDISTAKRINANYINANNTPNTSHYEFSDNDIVFNTAYHYWLQTIEYDGTIQYFGPITGKSADSTQEVIVLPFETKLGFAYPNPFNPSTTIDFNLAEDNNVKIEIYNIKGQKVKTLIDEYRQAGNHHIIWDGQDNLNHNCSNGLYFYKMQTNNYVNIKKVMLLK